MTQQTPGSDGEARPLTVEPGAPLALWDWRRSVADLYATVRRLPPREAWEAWVDGRSRLLRFHEQSPVPAERRASHDLSTFPYDPAARITATVEPTASRSIALAHSAAGATRAFAFGVTRFRLGGTAVALTLFQLDDYAGGVFLPFRDLTNGVATYGGGRYLLDTAKGADLGGSNGTVMLDFNFAYQPSCAFSERWSCPLAPPENHLDVAVNAGEKLP